MRLSLSTSILAIGMFLPVLTSAHVYMNVPGLYRNGVDEMPPVKPDGSDFPCSVPNFDKVQNEGHITPGKPKDGRIYLFGTAVHSGGSCQISITYDSPPRKNSNWRVLKSFEGACPIKAPPGGNLDPSLGYQNPLPTLVYMVPKGMPGGMATIAW